MKNSNLTFSIVSHGQINLIKNLLDDLEVIYANNFDVVLTINIPERKFIPDAYSFPISVIENDVPKGFGENHNCAFKKSNSNWFVVLNPDIRIKELNFDKLLAPFSDGAVAAVAPLIKSPSGTIEDSARFFPTLKILIVRFLLGARNIDYVFSDDPIIVDWVAGMFIVFRKSSFSAVNGFDCKRYFMYLEDADICYRFKSLGLNVVFNPCVSVIHYAQRASKKNIKHLRWHINSAFRFLTGL